MSHDLTVIVVAFNAADYLPACLRSIQACSRGIDVQIVVVDNGSTDGTRAMLAGEFPRVRMIVSSNRGFSHGNNEGLRVAAGRHTLLLNPDTEILEGELSELVAYMDLHRDVGVVGVRQLDSSGQLTPSIRRFPNARRMLGEALGSERWPVHPGWSGERELDDAAYERESPCDWTPGSFMLVRAEALWSAGVLDERFFLYSDDPDLCLRIRRAGWRVMHVPRMTIVHHDSETRGSPRLEAQAAYSRLLYARKHFPPLARGGFLAALALRYALRATVPGDPIRREAAGRSLATLLGRVEPPFGHGPTAAVAQRDDSVAVPSKLSGTPPAH